VKILQKVLGGLLFLTHTVVRPTSVIRKNLSRILQLSYSWIEKQR